MPSPSKYASPGTERRSKLRPPSQPLAVAQNCKASGSGLETAVTRQAATFTIEAYDFSGTRMTSGGETFRVDVRGSSVVRARVADNEDGSYTCKFVPSTSGAYTIAITLAGAALPGSCATPRGTNAWPWCWIRPN